MDKITTLIVDDNHVFKEPLLSFFIEHGEINVVGSVTGDQECLESTDRIRPLSSNRRTPETKILLCTVWSQRLLRKDNEQVSADGFFTTGEPPGHLLTSVHTLFGS